jgi:hypothetical protein
MSPDEAASSSMSLAATSTCRTEPTGQVTVNRTSAEFDAPERVQRSGDDMGGGRVASFAGNKPSDIAEWIAEGAYSPPFHSISTVSGVNAETIGDQIETLLTRAAPKS